MEDGPMQDKLPLTMKYHSRSGRYCISNGTDRNDPDFQLLQFPKEAVIGRLWKKHFPKVSFSLGRDLEQPIAGFWADVGGGTSPHDRKTFSDELLTLCEVAVTDL